MWPVFLFPVLFPAIPQSPFELTAKQVIAYYKASDNKYKGKDRFRYKKKHCHPQPKAKQHKPPQPLHTGITPLSPISRKHIETCLLYHMREKHFHSL